MKLSEYIVDRLAEWGVRHIFLVTGGGAMHLNDAIGGESRLKYICCHHEQACAIAAEGYSRVAEVPGVINVTTGPGAINTLNGIFGAWTDSIPLLIISGQVKRETCMAFHNVPGLRQLGDQEVDIVRMVQGITKYAVLLKDPSTVRYHLERAWHLATVGRPGPCWIDIPVDVQSAQIDPNSLKGYDSSEDPVSWNAQQIAKDCREIVSRLSEAKRPVILAGSGIRHSRTLQAFHRLIGKMRIPVATAWTNDLLAHDDPCYAGKQGSIGDRPGNLAVQNSDLLLILGSRLCIRQTSYNWKAFARKAFKIQVDADMAEMSKPLVKPDMPICSDLGLFFAEMEKAIDASGYSPKRHSEWLGWCKERVARYPVVQEKHRVFNGAINPYHFMEVLSDQMAVDDIVVCGDATATIVAFQAMRLKLGQRLFSNSGSASMGWDLPAAVGAAVAHKGRRVICLAGDGSVQMNLQELQTIVHHKLPVKIFVLNNGGYLSIRTTQSNFFGRFMGTGPESGVSFSEMTKIAAAYGIPNMCINEADFAGRVRAVLSSDGHFLAEIILDRKQTFEPRLSSKSLPDGRIVTAPPEDMYPFLDRDEFRSNLLIEEYEA